MLISLTISCGPKADRYAGSRHITVDFLDQPDPEAIGNGIASFEVIPIEFSKDKAISNIYSLAGNGRVIVAYGARERVFWIIDPKGKIIRQIRKYGEGPGEYLSPGLKFSVNDGGHIFFIDLGRKLLMEYNEDGTFIRSDSVPPYSENLELLGERNLVVSSMRIQEKEDAPGYSVSVFDRDIKVLKKFMPFFTSWPGGIYSPNLINWSNGIGISRLGDYNHYLLKPDHSLDTLIEFDFGLNRYDFAGEERMSFDRFMEFRKENFAKPMDAGFIYPSGRAFLALNMFREAPCIGTGSLDRDKITYRPVEDFPIIGIYHGFPVPKPDNVIEGKISGVLNAVDVIDFWEKHPEQIAIAEKDPNFRKIIDQLDIEDNPLIILFTLKN